MKPSKAPDGRSEPSGLSGALPQVEIEMQNISIDSLDPDYGARTSASPLPVAGTFLNGNASGASDVEQDGGGLDGGRGSTEAAKEFRESRTAAPSGFDEQDRDDDGDEDEEWDEVRDPQDSCEPPTHCRRGCVPYSLRC